MISGPYLGTSKWYLEIFNLLEFDCNSLGIFLEMIISSSNYHLHLLEKLKPTWN